MYKTALLILSPVLGFIIGYSALMNIDKYFLTQNQNFQNRKSVLSLQSEASSQSTIDPTDTPTPEATDVPTHIPTKIPTIIPTPTNIPSPVPTKVIVVPNDLEPLFDEFSKIYNVDEYKLKKIANCESHFNRGVWKEPYAGMYQFTDTTWTKYRNMMGKDPNLNLRFGARESIETAAFVLSIGNEHIWPVCSK